MRCGRVLLAASAAVACSLSSTPRAAPPSEGGACAAITRDLLGQIETLKELKAHPDNGFKEFSSTKKHPEKPEDPQKELSRERERIETLNIMLPGMGCPRLDIDHELAQPLNQALLPPASKDSKKHHKHGF